MPWKSKQNIKKKEHFLETKKTVLDFYEISVFLYGSKC